MHACVHVRACVRACVRANASTTVHVRERAKLAALRASECARERASMRACMHTAIRSHSYFRHAACVCSRMHVCSCPHALHERVCAYVCACKHVCVHTSRQCRQSLTAGRRRRRRRRRRNVALLAGCCRRARQVSSRLRTCGAWRYQAPKDPTHAPATQTGLRSSHSPAPIIPLGLTSPTRRLPASSSPHCAALPLAAHHRRR